MNESTISPALPHAPNAKPQEVWKVVEYGGIVFPHYSVSNLGRVRSKSRTVGRRSLNGGILKPFAHGQGGPDKVTIISLGVQRTVAVHTLVATAFLGPRPAGHSIIHLNGSMLDCRACNLRYVTPSAASEHNREIRSTGKRRVRPLKNGSTFTAPYEAKREASRRKPDCKVA